MEQKRCRICLEESPSTDGMITILKAEAEICEGCPEQPVLQTVSEQYQAQRPRWWQINGELIIPVWLVERIKRFK